MICDKLNKTAANNAGEKNKRSTDKMVDLYQTEEMKVFGKVSRYIANCACLLILLLKENQNKQEGVTQSGFTL